MYMCVVHVPDVCCTSMYSNVLCSRFCMYVRVISTINHKHFNPAGLLLTTVSHTSLYMYSNIGAMCYAALRERESLGIWV